MPRCPSESLVIYLMLESPMSIPLTLGSEVEVTGMQSTERWAIGLRMSGFTGMFAISSSTGESIGVYERVTYLSLIGEWGRRRGR